MPRKQPTVADGIDSIKRGLSLTTGATVYSSVSSDPQDTDTYRHMTQEEKDCMKLAKREVARVCEKYDAPISPSKIVVAVCGHPSVPKCINGQTTPVCCGEYGVAFEGRDQKWTVEKTPEKYVLFLSAATTRPGYERRKTVRHEMAHIINWEQDGYTVEQRDNHAEWLERLDATER